MPEAPTSSRRIIAQELMLARLAQSDQMREFFIQMWLQNPALANQGGAQVRALLKEIAPVTAGQFTFPVIARSAATKQSRGTPDDRCAPRAGLRRRPPASSQ